MQLIHGLAARGLVQTVDVLGHDGPAFALALQRRQTQVGRVGLCPVDDELLAVEVKKFCGVGLVEGVGEHRLGRVLEFWWYSPSTERKSGMPLSVETPAPPKKTMLFVAARISSNAGTMQTAPFAFGFYAL